ncbi:hypothetical protein L7F22_068453 [Adiantum nelumboides]|nr:hypothetical protein [Adiantum nelumboides]
MGPKEDAHAPFEGQEVLVTRLIGKLCIHVQEYMDKEDFYVSVLKHVNVLLGSPWFICMSASLQFPNRVMNFQHRGRDIAIHANDKGNTISESFNKTIKKCIFAYRGFAKDSMADNQQISSLTSNSFKEEEEACVQSPRLALLVVLTYLWQAMLVSSGHPKKIAMQGCEGLQQGKTELSGLHMLGKELEFGVCLNGVTNNTAAARGG